MKGRGGHRENAAERGRLREVEEERARGGERKGQREGKREEEAEKGRVRETPHPYTSACSPNFIYCCVTITHSTHACTCITHVNMPSLLPQYTSMPPYSHMYKLVPSHCTSTWPSLHCWPCPHYTSVSICCTSMPPVTILCLAFTLLCPHYTPMHFCHPYLHHDSMPLLGNESITCCSPPPVKLVMHMHKHTHTCAHTQTHTNTYTAYIRVGKS